VSSFDGQFDNTWKVSIKSNTEKKIRYTVTSEESIDASPFVEGILAEMVTGANALPKKRANE